MTYLVVGKRDGDRWQLDVKDVGTTSADDLSGIEPAVRELLREHGVADSGEVDLQLLMPDFEVDLSERQVPRGSSFDRSIVSGVILLVVAVAADRLPDHLPDLTLDDLGRLFLQRRVLAHRFDGRAEQQRVDADPEPEL